MGGESGGKAVLVADDEPLLRRLVGRVLRDHGFDVTLVGDGDAAVACVMAEGGERFGVAVVDAGMPPQGGALALKAMRARRPELKAVVMSGSSPDPALREFLTTSGGVFLAKPFAPEELVRVISDAMQAGAGRLPKSPTASGQSSGD